MQRLHEDDLVGHVLQQGDWKVPRFPAIAVEDETQVIKSLYGTRTVRQKLGEALHPQRESLESSISFDESPTSLTRSEGNPGYAVRHVIE